MRLGEAPDMSLPVLLSVRKVPGGATPSQQEAAVSAVPPGPPSLPTAAASAPSSSKKRSFFRIFHRSATLLFQGQIYTYESLRDEAFTEIKLSHSLIGPKKYSEDTVAGGCRTGNGKTGRMDHTGTSHPLLHFMCYIDHINIVSSCLKDEYSVV